jgi:2-polyprenyl-3-methyl-5-hydroxy-6-metoxy-1,4-benzoquinol methylase
MASVVGQEFWDKSYEEAALRFNPDEVQFKDLFDKYLPRGGTCFEVGCYPGRYLIHLGREFGYTVSGIDATPGVDRLADHIRANGVSVGNLYRGDFLTFAPPERYDVVCSFGFLEHFSNFDDVIRRHLDYLKPGGTLVLSCPNFRRAQYLLHRLLDAENLARHHLPAMDLNRWAQVLEANQMQITYKGFYRTADFWSESPHGRLGHLAAVASAKVMRTVDRWVHRPNRWTSPFLVCIASRPAGTLSRGKSDADASGRGHQRRI